MVIPVEASTILGLGVVALALLLAVFGIRPGRGLPRPKALDEMGRRLQGKPTTWQNKPAIAFTWHGEKSILCDWQQTTVVIESSQLSKPRVLLSSGFNDRKSQAGVEVGGITGLNVIGGEIGEIAEFLSPSVKRVLQDLHLLGQRKPDARLIVELGPAFKVSVEPAVKSEDLARFVMLSLQLAEHARLFAQRDAGVRVVREETVAGGLCQICGVSLDDAVVRCARCSTPHHQECWEYAGSCSTFACQERRFVR